MEHSFSQKRKIFNLELFSNKSQDATFSLSSFFQSIIWYTLEDCTPSRLHFYITKNKNPKLTNENEILSLTLPVIPPCYNTNSMDSMFEFVNDTTDSQSIQEKLNNTDRNLIDERILYYANDMNNYIKNEIALRYLATKDNKETKITQLLSNLNIMKDFNFEIFEMVNNNPTKIIEYTKMTDNNKYAIEFESGKIKKLSAKDLKTFKLYQKA